MVLKMIIAAVVVALVTEFSKVSPKIGGLIASLPIVSIISIWIFYIETKDLEKASKLPIEILSFLIPSVTFFVVLPFLTKLGINFHLSMVISILLTILSYAIYYRVVS